MKEGQAVMPNNLFFQKEITDDHVKTICGRAVDIIPSILEDPKETRVGKLVISLTAEEMEDALATVAGSKNYVCIGDTIVRVVGTSIEVDAMAIEFI